MVDFEKALSSKPKHSWEVLAKTSGQWPHLLRTIGGLHEQYLSGYHSPCPCCGGTDRYRWMNDEGPGGWYCSHCGGKRQQGGGGSGIDLLMRLRNWSFRDAIQQIERYYDCLPFQPAKKKEIPLPKETAISHKHSELERFLLLELAGQLTNEEFFSPAGAKVRLYSKRWAVYAAANHDAARSAVLQFETARGILEWVN